MKRKPTLCVDFDGVIHSYSGGWKGDAATIPDPPVPGAIEFLKAALESFTVVIHSSRFNCSGPERYRVYRAVKDWFIKHGMDEPTCRDVWEDEDEDEDTPPFILCAVKPPAFVTLDDRAVAFTGTFPAPAELLTFKPWNRK